MLKKLLKKKRATMFVLIVPANNLSQLQGHFREGHSDEWSNHREKHF